MIQEVLTTELLTIRKRAEQTEQNIDRISRNLHAEQQGFRRMVEEYSVKRVELIIEELRARGMTWCTLCAKELWRTPEVLPEKETELLLLKGREEYSHGYGNAYHGFRDFSRLHRACPKCRKTAYDKHGTRGCYSTQAKDQSSFYAFCVEKREDGYYARKFGNWVKLDDKDCKLAEPSNSLVEELAKKWNLPPRIELDYGDCKLMVHEQAAMAEAV